MTTRFRRRCFVRLATGKRDYVLVDAYGGMHALPKLIEDKMVRTKDVRARLQTIYPLESLPSVEEAASLVAKHRAQTDRAWHEEGIASRLEALKQAQSERRSVLERALAGLRGRQEQARFDQERNHKAARVALGDLYRQTRLANRERREANRPRGLAAFLARVSGVALIREALHRREDAKHLAAYVAESRAVRQRQAGERRALGQRCALQDKEAQRQRDDQKKIDARELAAFLRDEQRERRIRERGGGDLVPSLLPALERQQVLQEELRPDLLVSFSIAADEHADLPPDLMAAFERATSPSPSDGTAQGERSAEPDQESGLDKDPPGRRR